MDRAMPLGIRNIKSARTSLRIVKEENIHLKVGKGLALQRDEQIRLEK